MKLVKEIALPNRKNIEVELKLGKETLTCTIQPKSNVDQKKLAALDERLKKEDEAPKRYAELVELVGISKALLDGYDRKLNKEFAKEEKDRDQDLIDSLQEKKDRELESLREMIEERDRIGETPYNADAIFEEKAKLFCVDGFDALEKHAKIFGWRETLYLIGTLLVEADAKK